MTDPDGFYARYAAALRSYLSERGEASLAVGHDLGRWALAEQISMLEIIENHIRLVEAPPTSRINRSIALQFLLQTLATFDVATRGFIDGTRRYEHQRARAEHLADRDAFRSALVNSLQEGFFVADHDGAVIEANDAFADITGYGAGGLPYRWPHPWVADEGTASEQLSRLLQIGNAAYETPIRHRDGHQVWVAISINTVTTDGSDRRAYVGTIRDITAARAAAARDNAVVRLATAAGGANTVAEVLAILLEECRTAIDLQRVVAVMWPKSDADPAIHVAGAPFQTTWRDLDPFVRETFEEARHWSPLSVQPVESADYPGKSRGIVAVLSGPGDVALWLEHNAPRRISVDDQLLITALVGHLSLAMQHVQQFETAREASLTLQRAMLPTMQPPSGFAVRYEPAVPPLEIGGDWYDVLPVSEHQIGIIVGDCVGRGLPAAAVMGQLRSSARALLLTGAEPALLLEELDAAAALIPDAYCTTVFLAILDTESAILRYSSAGHVPAVLASPQSRPTLLADASSVPLAVQRSGARPQSAHPLPPGSTLMLFTDGLVERRDNDIDAGIARVAEVLSNTMGAPAEAVADAVLRELSPPEGYDDDVAIVVYRRPQPALHIELPAVPERLVEVRNQLSAWLEAQTVPDILASDIVLAVNEACTNSAEHAYRGGSAGTMRLEAEVCAGEIQVRVVDSGTWKLPVVNTPTGGRGIPLMRAVCDRVDLDGSPAGTTVVMRFRVPTAESLAGS